MQAPLIATLLAVLATTSAWAGPSRGSTGPGQGYVSGCAGFGAGVSQPGTDVVSGFAADADCHWQTFDAGGSGTAQASNAQSGATGTAQGGADFGSIHLASTFTTPGGGTFKQSYTGSITGGWTDSLTLNNLPPGQTATLNFSILVDGSLLADGPNAFSRAQLYGLVNGALVAGTVQGWKVQTFDTDTHEQATVHEVVHGTALVTTGQAFLLEVYGAATSGSGGSGIGFAQGSSGSADFAHTFTWGGIDSVLIGGVLQSGWTVSSQSGVDWALPYAAAVPEPAMPLLMLAGGAWLWLRRRR